MSDFSKPVSTDDADEVLDEIRAQIAAILLQDFSAATNIPTDATRWNPSTLIPEKYNGASWARLGLKCSADQFLGKPVVDTSLAAGDCYVFDGTNFVRSPVNVDGWVSPPGTWTRASANTITTSYTATTYHSVGDKVVLFDTTYKYFYIIAVAANTITVIGDTTGLVGTITSYRYSKGASPQGHPIWFPWTPSPGGYSANPTLLSRFCLEGRTCFAHIHSSGAGTSNSTSHTLTGPITCAASAIYSHVAVVGGIDNGSTLNTCCGVIVGNTTTINLYTTHAGGGWTSSGSKHPGNMTLIYEI